MNDHARNLDTYGDDWPDIGDFPADDQQYDLPEPVGPQTPEEWAEYHADLSAMDAPTAEEYALAWAIVQDLAAASLSMDKVALLQSFGHLRTKARLLVGTPPTGEDDDAQP